MGRERRHFPRVSQPFGVQYRRSSELGDVWHAVQTLNLGAGGIRFRDTELLNIGDELDLQIQLPSAQEVLTVRGCVAWSQLEASGVTDTGVAFVEATERQQQAVDNLVQFLRKSEPAAGSSR